MWIVQLALRRPYTFIVLALLLTILGWLTIERTAKDIFPRIDIPVVSVIWTYSGLPPDEMVVTNLGAGELRRARGIAWTAVAIGAGATEIIGLTVALAPNLWLDNFTHVTDVLVSGALYLRTVGPFYGCFGAAMILYFCAQGAGNMLWPLVGSIARLLLATVGAWMAVRQFGGGLAGLTVMVAASYIVFAAINAMVLRRTAACPSG